MIHGFKGDHVSFVDLLKTIDEYREAKKQSVGVTYPHDLNEAERKLNACAAALGIHMNAHREAWIEGARAASNAVFSCATGIQSQEAMYTRDRINLAINEVIRAKEAQTD